MWHGSGGRRIATGWDDSGTDSPCPFLCSVDDDFWKELSGLTGGPLHSLVDRIERVIMLDKAPSTVKAYISAFKRWHRWATELKLPTLPAKAPHVALFLLHLAQETASCAATTQSVAALRWMHEKASVDDPTSHPTVKQLCQALRRLHSRPIHRKPPLSPLQFKEVISCLACDSAPPGGSPDSDDFCPRLLHSQKCDDTYTTSFGHFLLFLRGSFCMSRTIFLL